MTLRERLSAELKSALREGDRTRLSTLRLINAAIKDLDIKRRGEGAEDGADEAEILQLLQKMIRQRRESADAYEQGGRMELAEGERAEIRVIEEFLPRPLSPEEMEAAIDAAIRDAGASSIRDMGKVMGLLKQRYPGRMDFAEASRKVKARLG